MGLLLLLAVFLFFAYFDTIAQRALESASASIPGRLKVKRFSPTWDGVKLEGVSWELDGPDPFFEAESVDVTIDKTALLRRDWLVLVRYAKVIKPGLKVVVDREGNLNLRHLLESKAEPRTIDINRLRMVVEFVDGWIVYNDQREAGFLYDLSGWNGTAAFPDGERLLLKTSAHPAREQDSLAKFEGEISLDRPRVSLNVDLEKLALLPFAGYPGFGQGLTLIQGTVDGSALVQGSAQEWNEVLESLFLVGTMELKEGLLATPWLPIDLKDLEGKVAMTGREVSTDGFQGKAAGIPFEVDGQADLNPEGNLDGHVEVGRFSLDQIKPYMENPPDIKGQAEVEIDVAGSITDPTVSGLARGYDLSFQGQTVPTASTRFLKIKNLVQLSDVVAQTAAGKVQGEGWLFLGDKPRILFALNGTNADPSAVMADLAQSADFRVRVLGEVDDPLLYGNGELRGLGSWAQGAGSAQGSFILSGQDLMVIDGLAFKGSSTVNIPVASLDLESRQLDGLVSTENFSLSDMPGMDGVSGQVSGRALVSADLSGETPRFTAQGTLTDGTFAAAGYQASQASGDFSFDGYQMIIPDANANFEGSRINLAGVFDVRDQALSFNARSDSLNLARLGLPGESAAVIGSVSGQLGGALGIYGYANSSRGEGALSAFQRGDGTVGGVAWVDGSIPGQKDSNVLATVVAGGTLDRLSMEYTGQATAPVISKLGPLDLYGGATLANQVLTLRPTIIAASDSARPRPLPYIAYSGAAYPFFGPLLAGPLKKVVVEDTSFPTGRSLSLNGKANLANRRLDLRFHLRAANLEELANQPLGGDPDAASINETLPFNVLSGFGAVRGSITGSMGAPRILADYDIPWLLLANGYENRRAMSSKGRVELSGQNLRIASAAVSEQPFDRRLSGDPAGLYAVASKISGLMAARGLIEAGGRFDLRLATAGFDAGFLSLISPETYRRYLPYGRLATENLHIWGTATNPALAGVVRLVGGGIFLAGEGFPFQAASMSFSTQGGETRVDDLVLSAPGVNLRGFGKRSSTGELSGQITAQDVDLTELHRFGPPLSGLSGRADAIVELTGKFPRQPRIEIAAAGRNLSWNPAAIGGTAGAVAIEELALGHFSPEGDSLTDGLSVYTDAQGWHLELPERGLRFRTAAAGLSLEAEGAVRFPGGLPDLRMFKTFSDWGRYFVSANGPDLGQAGEPFEVRAQNWSFAELARLMGRGDFPYRAGGSAAVALQGQWWRDHAREATGQLPLYSLSLDALKFEGDRANRASGFELQKPAAVRYQREGDAGYLSLQDLSLGFFSGPAPVAVVTPSPGASPTPATEESASPSPSPAIPISDQGTLEADAHLALTQLPETKPVSTMSLRALDIPMDNLAFLLPEGLPLGGLVENVDVTLQGLLPSPDLSATALLTNLSLGPLREMTMRGVLTGGDDGAGGYRLALGDENDPALTLTFGDTETAQHQMKAEGSATLLWRRTGPLDDTRLNLFSNKLAVSPDSPVDLTAQVVDTNLRILADAVEGRDTARGEFSANLNVNGTLGYPQFEGKATMADGEFRSERYGDFENLKLDASLERITREEAEPSEVLDALGSGLITRLSASRFEGTLGKKPFFAGGKAEFAGISPTYLKMFFVGEALPLELPDLFTGTADVDLELRGQVARRDGRPSLDPVVIGDVVIPRGDFDVPVGAVEGDAATLGLPLDYDISLDLGQEFYVHLYNSSVRAVGQLRLVSEEGKPRLYGRTELSRGQIRIPFYDASFRVRQGVAYFEGPMIPRLESVEAVADLGTYRVIVRVEGTYPDALSVNLFSDPPLPQSELSRLVVLGGLPGQFSGINDPNQAGSSLDGGGSLGSLSGSGVSFLSGILTNRLTEPLGRAFFLSEVSFDYIPPASYVIKLAKALDPNDTFLLTLTRVIRDNGINENLYGIEWRLTQTFLTRVALDSLNQIRFWIQSINRF